MSWRCTLSLPRCIKYSCDSQKAQFEEIELVVPVKEKVATSRCHKLQELQTLRCCFENWK